MPDSGRRSMSVVVVSLMKSPRQFRPFGFFGIHSSDNCQTAGDDRQTALLTRPARPATACRAHVGRSPCGACLSVWDCPARSPPWRHPRACRSSATWRCPANAANAPRPAPRRRSPIGTHPGLRGRRPDRPLTKPTDDVPRTRS